MYPAGISMAWFLLFTIFLSAVVVSAVNQDEMRLAMDLVAKNAYLNYHNNKHTMQHHAKAVASTKSHLETLLKEGQNLDVAKNQAFCQKVLSLVDERRNGLEAFNRASTAAAQCFETNRRIHQTMKGIRPAENIVKKALQLVANNAAQKFSNHMRASLLHDAQSSAAFEAWPNVGKGADGRIRLSVPQRVRKKDSNRHQRQSIMAQRESMRVWYVNRRLHATVKGVNTPQFESDGEDFHKVLQATANKRGRKAPN